VKVGLEVYRFEQKTRRKLALFGAFCAHFAVFFYMGLGEGLSQASQQVSKSASQQAGEAVWKRRPAGPQRA
jgi:hypothetical protein